MITISMTVSIMQNATELKEGQGIDLNRYKGHRDMIRAIAYAPNGQDLYTTGSDGKILKWDNSDYSYKTLYQPSARYH